MEPHNLFHVFAPLRGSDKGSLGTGYAIGERLIITALHVVTNRNEEAVANPGSVKGVTVMQFMANGQKVPYHEIPVECVAASAASDIALLRLRNHLEFRQRCATPDAATVDHNSGNVDCGATGFPEIVRGEEPSSYFFDGTFLPRAFMGEPCRAIGLKATNVRKPKHWRGMSGAAVFAAGTDTMLGVVVKASRKLKGREIRFATLGCFVDELMCRNDRQKLHLPEAWKKKLRLYKQGDSQEKKLADLHGHLYTLDYAHQVEVATAEIGDGSRIARPVFMIVQGLRDDRLVYVVHRIVEDVLKGHRHDRFSETVDAWWKQGREKPLEVKIRGFLNGGRKDVEEARTKFLEVLNSSGREFTRRELTRNNFVDAVRELTEYGDGPRVFYSRLSMSSFGKRGKGALGEWMDDWEAIASDLPSCGLVYFFLLEKDMVEKFARKRGRWLAFVFWPVLRWRERNRMHTCRYTIQGVREMKCIDLGEVEPVPWDWEIQEWIESELLRDRLGFTREELGVLLEKASDALDVSKNSEFRLNEICRRFLDYETA